MEELKNQLGILMNSLATLSAEKSRMEANFQADRKTLRNEREEVIFSFKPGKSWICEFTFLFLSSTSYFVIFPNMSYKVGSG